MGVMTWFKDKFNIGGLKIKIVEVEPITAEEGWVNGKVTYTSGKPVLAETTYKLLSVTTKGTGEDKKTETSTIGQMTVLVGVVMSEPGTETSDFTFPYDFRGWLEKRSGVLGAAGKLASFAQSTFGDKGTSEYFVEISANIKGVWAAPSDRIPIKVMVAR